MIKMRFDCKFPAKISLIINTVDVGEGFAVGVMSVTPQDRCSEYISQLLPLTDISVNGSK